MAEALAVASGVAGLLSLTIEVYSVSSRYISCVKHASSAILALQRELKTLKTILSELNKALERSEGEKLFVNRSSSLSSIENVAAYREVLQELQNKLLKESSKTGFPAKFKTFTWPFNEEKTQRILDVLRRHVSAFGQALSIDSFWIGAEIFKEVQFLGDEKREQRKASMLEWLSPAVNDMQRKQHDFFAKRVGSTGDWLLKYDDFKHWTEGPSPLIVWCLGDPGTGKTILSSIVVDHLSQKCFTDEVARAVIFCDYKDQKSQTTLNLLGNITRQLIQGRSLFFKPLEELYKRLEDRAALPTLKDYEALLHAACHAFKSTYIVIDALDELLPEHRKTLFPIIRNMQQQTSARVLVTSRPHAQDIERAFRDQKKVAVRAPHEDIEQLVRTRVEGDEDLLDAMDGDHELKEKVIQKVTSSAQGIILLPTLQLNHLKNLFSKSQVKQALLTMPKDLFGMYHQTLDRIKQQGFQRSELALTVLGWISHARRPLLIGELRHALAVEFHDDNSEERRRKLDDENLMRPQLLVDVCAGLITIEAESRVVRLVHFTTQEFFNQNSGSLFPDVPAKIAGTCLTYLLVDEFESGPCLQKDRLHGRLDEFQFLDYAATHWGDHVRGALEGRFLDLILELVRNDKKLCASVEACNLREPEFFRWCNLFGKRPSGFGALHCAASQGLDEAIRVLLAEGADPCQVDGTFKTPVHWAAWRGHCSSLNLLLDTGVDLHIASGDDFLLLETAVDQGHEEAVRLLLNRGFDVNRQGFGKGAAILTAVHMGHENLVHVLLEHGADWHLKNQFGETALFKGALSGHEGIMKMLLSHSTDIKITNACGNTALHCAAYLGRTNVVRQLLDAGAGVDTASTNGATALHMAARQGHEDTVRLLIEKGANIEAKTADVSDKFQPLVKEIGRCIPMMVRLNTCGEGATPLFEATLHCQESVVKCLLELGAYVEARNAEFNTPLMAAAQSAYHNHLGGDRLPLKTTRASAMSIAQILIGNGAKVKDFCPRSRWMAIHYAARDGFQELVELLIRNGVDAKATTELGFGMLEIAAMYRQADLVEWLIEQGADIAHKSNAGWTALHLAARNKSVDAMKILLDSNADIEASGAENRTPLIMAILSQSLETVQFLLDRGADIDPSAVSVALCNDEAAITKLFADRGVNLAALSKEGSLLHLAAAQGKVNVLRVLLECGASPASKDQHGDTPLHFAARSGRTEAVRSLLEHGSEIDAFGYRNHTPLFLAALQGHEDTVALLCEKGADINHNSSPGMTALGAALKHGRIGVARLLAKAGAKLDPTYLAAWLQYAYKKPDCLLLQFLFENHGEFLRKVDETWSTLFHFAVECRNEEFARFLVARNVNVNVKDAIKGTALEFAIRRGSLGVVKVLLESGANTAETFHGTNLVQLALDIGGEDIALCLLRHGVEFDANDALFSTCRSGMTMLIVVLLDQAADIPMKRLADVGARDERGNTALHVASFYGQVKCMRLLLVHGADLEAENNDGETPLFSSTLAAAKLLVDSGADVDVPNKRGRTTLQSAVITAGKDTEDSLDHVKFLISRGADVNLSDIVGNTPLHLACKGGSAEMVALLVANGGEVTGRNADGNQPLHLAAQAETKEHRHGVPDELPSETQLAVEEIIKLLERHGANINAPGQHCRTALHFAVDSSSRLVEYLLDQGADLEAEDDEKRTPLLHACSIGDPAKIVGTLLQRGADMYTVDRRNHTALALALQGEWYGVAEKLLRHGFQADADVLDVGCTALHDSARSGYSALLEQLLKQKSMDIELKDGTGVTALGRAVEKDELKCVQLLLKYGANPDTVAPCKYSTRHLDPLVVVAARGFLGVLRSLLEAGANPNVSNHQNNTPLMWAAQLGQVDCLTMLLETGVIEVNAVDDDGDTALNCAAVEGQFESTKILLERSNVDRGIKNLLGRTAKDTAEDGGHHKICALFEADDRARDLGRVDEVKSPDEAEGGGIWTINQGITTTLVIR